MKKGMKQATWLYRGKLFQEKRREVEDILGQECAMHVQELGGKKAKEYGIESTKVNYSGKWCWKNSVGHINFGFAPPPTGSVISLK